MRAPRWLTAAPPPRRHPIVGAVLLGAIGALAGLTVGLDVYAPTAWFALFELGVPAAVLGGTLGLISGVVAARRSR